LNTDGFSVYNSTGSRLHLFNITASRAISASWAPFTDTAGTFLYTGSTYQITASSAVSASWAPFTDTGTILYTGSTYQITASSAVSASWAPFTDTGTILYTGSTYQITASSAVSASWAPFTQVEQISASWASASLVSTTVVGAVMKMNYATTISVDLATMFHTASLTGPVFITASNLGPGKMASIKLTTDGTMRNVGYPASWVWLQTVPIAISASKTGIVSLVSYGSTDSDVVAVYATQL
jgi:hypothetical protein